MAIPGNRRKMNRPYLAEAVMVRRIDTKKEFFECLTPLEVLALNIACGNQKPAGKYTREWATKLIEKIGVAKCTGIIVQQLFERSDLQTAMALSSFLPRPPQVQKIEADVKQTNTNKNFNVDVDLDSLSQEELEEFCQRTYGKTPFIED